jgi:hypothetical protein
LVVEPGALPVVVPVPPMDDPVVLPVAAVPPAAELAPEPVPLCANANVLDSASAPAKAIVVNLMIRSFIDDCESNRGPALCSGFSTSVIDRDRCADHELGGFRC